MWRPETNAEKNERENPKPKDSSKPKQEPTIIPDHSGEGGVVGCFASFAKGLEYAMFVMCCCGCGTSYDEYNDI